jgi:hypothetical protein
MKTRWKIHKANENFLVFNKNNLFKLVGFDIYMVVAINQSYTHKAKACCLKKI